MVLIKLSFKKIVNNVFTLCDLYKAKVKGKPWKRGTNELFKYSMQSLVLKNILISSK